MGVLGPLTAAAMSANAPAAASLTFRVSAAGQTHDVALVRKKCDPSVDRPIVGIVMVNSFPFPLSISSGDIGGPSAGLMWSIGLYDLLTPDDLTSGRTIAGTGTIDLDGKVGPIGGIADKVVAARRVGATVFLAPKDNMRPRPAWFFGSNQFTDQSAFPASFPNSSVSAVSNSSETSLAPVTACAVSCNSVPAYVLTLLSWSRLMMMRRVSGSHTPVASW